MWSVWKSLTLATEKIKDNNCFILCFRKSFPCPGANTNCQKKLFFRKTRAQFALSFSYLEWERLSLISAKIQRKLPNFSIIDWNLLLDGTNLELITELMLLICWWSKMKIGKQFLRTKWVINWNTINLFWGEKWIYKKKGNN